MSSTRAPCPSRVKSVFPRRALSSAMIALAAARIWPVERKLPDVDGVRKVALELSYVCDIRPAPAVDRLVVVAHGEEPLAMQGEHLEPSVLGKIDVLVFVGMNPIELSGPLRPVIGVMEERERGPEEKIAEVGG